METSLSLRSLERTLEEMLLPTLEELRHRKGSDSAAWAFAAPGRRLAVPRTGRHAARRGRGILIGDASEGVSDPDCLYIRVLDLLCTRSGALVLTLPVERSGGSTSRCARSTRCGGDRGRPRARRRVARWAYGVRRAAGDVPFLLFHRRARDGLTAPGRARYPAPPRPRRRRCWSG